MISFIARPIDSRKGLQTFLDGISIVLSCARVPQFTCWIVGGTTEEADYVYQMASWRPNLEEMVDNGRITIWGRVSYESLAEFYSRSSVVVMPSSREQFGLTAIETMMCGRPVVATAVGGLVDAIVDDFTGTLIYNNDSNVLANVLTGYLRNKARREYLGRNAASWAKFSFSREHSYLGFLNAYKADHPLSMSAFRTPLEWRQEEILKLTLYIEESLKLQVSNVSDFSCSGHLSFGFDMNGSKYFAKAYAPDPTMDSSVFDIPEHLCPDRTFSEFELRCQFHQENIAAPKALFYFPDKWLIVFEWGDPVIPASSDDLSVALAEIAGSYRSYRTLDDSSPQLANYFSALESFTSEENLETLLSFDEACAKLNAGVFGVSSLRFAQTHPQVELIRYKVGLLSRIWSLPDAFTTRALAVIEQMVSRRPISVAPPRGCNGSLKPEHLLQSRSGLFACDIDSCRYTVGPFDESHYLYKRVIREGIGPDLALRSLQALVSDPDDFYLGSCWLISDLLYNSLSDLAAGKRNGIEIFMNFSHALHSTAWDLFGDYESH